MTAAEIRVAATKFEKKSCPKTGQLHYDPDQVRTLVVDRLEQFAFLNNPPTTAVSVSWIFSHIKLTIRQGDLLANPILEQLCKSFYEEEKWQRSLLLHIDGDNEWASSVTITMVAFAATAVSTLPTQ